MDSDDETKCINTLESLREVKNYFQHKMDLFNFLKNEMLFLYKIIISTLNNIQNNFLIKKIGNEEYTKNLSNRIPCSFISFHNPFELKL